MIVQGIRKIRYEDLERAVRNKIYVDDILFNHLSRYTKNPALEPLIRAVIRTNWDLVEDLLCNPFELYRVLTHNRPEFKKLLDTREGREWLNEVRKRGYEKLYSYAFQN